MLNGSLDKTQHHFMITFSDRLRIPGTDLTTLKAVYSKSIANINLNGEKLKAFPLKAEMRQCCPLSSHLFNIVLQFLATAVR